MGPAQAERRNQPRVAPHQSRSLPRQIQEDGFEIGLYDIDSGHLESVGLGGLHGRCDQTRTAGGDNGQSGFDVVHGVHFRQPLEVHSPGLDVLAPTGDSETDGGLLPRP